MKTAVVAEFCYLPIDQVHESALNQRRHQDDAKFQELVESIKAIGILTPLLVRPNADGYEVAAGHRRLNAGRAAGFTDVPCRVRPMDDGEFLEVLTIENLQREDVHPLDEARGYQALLARPGYDVDVLAAKIGKSKSYVYQRLKLTELVPEVQEAFEADQITAGHAILIARLRPDDQARALEASFRDDYLHYDDEEETKPKKVLQSVRNLDEWIAEHCRLNFADLETQQELPVVVEAVRQAEAAGAPLLELSTSYGVAKEVPAGVLHHSKYREIAGRKNRCEHAQRAVIVHGEDRRGEVVEVCANRKCKKHFPPAPKEKRAPAYDWKAENEKREREQKRWEAVKPHALAIVVEKTKGLKVTDAMLLEVIKESARSNAAAVIKAVGGAVTLKTFAQALALAEAYDHAWSRENLAPIAKKYRIDLAKLEKEHAPKADAQAGEKPKGKKKAARTR